MRYPLLAHELNQPLAATLPNAQVLRRLIEAAPAGLENAEREYAFSPNSSQAASTPTG